MATAAREDVAGGCTAFAAAWLMVTTKITASVARAAPRPAGAKPPAADSARRAQSEMTAQLAGTRVSTGREEDEQEDSGDENTGLMGRASPVYGELSSHFGVLEVAAEESGNGDA